MTGRERLREVRLSLKRELKVYRTIARDSRAPRRAKVLLGLAIGYALIVPGLIVWALR